MNNTEALQRFAGDNAATIFWSLNNFSQKKYYWTHLPPNYKPIVTSIFAEQLISQHLTLEVAKRCAIDFLKTLVHSVPFIAKSCLCLYKT